MTALSKILSTLSAFFETCCNKLAMRKLSAHNDV